MAVNGVSGTSNSTLTNSRQGIADNFDTFLSILTTQLKNQNPLDPLDTNQFTSQLVQFTSVEQQLKTNEFLEALMVSTQGSVDSTAVSYIGKTVTASGDASELIDGQAVWGFNAASAAASATVTIKDANGNVVHTETGSLASGAGQFVWDGKGDDGVQRQDGTYSITIEAKNSTGGIVAVSTELTGTVSAVDLSGDEPKLTVGTQTVAMSDVTSVK
jgi:flagellar basal-body rod modification protein FlgD